MGISYESAVIVFALAVALLDGPFDALLRLGVRNLDASAGRVLAVFLRGSANRLAIGVALVVAHAAFPFAVGAGGCGLAPGTFAVL